MLQFEFKKYNKLYISLLAAFILIWFQILLTAIPKMEKKIQDQYEDYIQTLNGPLTVEKMEYMEEENARVNGFLSNISTEDMMLGITDAYRYAEEHQEAWNMIYDRFQSFPPNKDEQVFFQDLWWMQFLKRNAENLPELLLVIIITICAFSVEIRDEGPGMLRTTLWGKKKLFQVKTHIILICSLAASFFFIISEWSIIILKGKWNDMLLPVRSMTPYSNLPWKMNIIIFLILRSIWHIMWILIASDISMTIILIMKKVQPALFTALAFLILPSFVIGSEPAAYLFWLPSFWFHKDFAVMHMGMPAFVYWAVLFVFLRKLNKQLWLKL